jgi:hypothetical protein
MKRDVLAIGLVSVLIAATLATVGMCYMYLKTAQRVREMQTGLNQVNHRRQVIQSMAMDLNEYARRNPTIIPLLQELNLRPRSSTNAAPAPAKREGQP